MYNSSLQNWKNRELITQKAMTLGTIFITTNLPSIGILKKIWLLRMSLGAKKPESAFTCQTQHQCHRANNQRLQEIENIQTTDFISHATKLLGSHAESLNVVGDINNS